MIFDAHVHIGYYPRKGYDRPSYYSPRRICTVLKKCGVDEFIYSSTSMQTHGIDFGDVNREMLEVRRIFGTGAHPFLWVTKRYHFANPKISDIQYGFYEGVKLHGLDGSQWITENAGALENVLSIAENCNKPVMIHTGREEDARPSNYIPFILNHPNLRFNLAHGRPAEEVEECMGASDSVFADISYMDPDEKPLLYKDSGVFRTGDSGTLITTQKIITKEKGKVNIVKISDIISIHFVELAFQAAGCIWYFNGNKKVQIDNMVCTPEEQGMIMGLICTMARECQDDTYKISVLKGSL